MQKIETKEAAIEYFSGNTVKCLVCGKNFKVLAKHVYSKHQLTAEQYKDKFNLPRGRGLCCVDARKNYAKAAKKRYDAGELSLLKSEEPRVKPKGPFKGHRSYDMERLASDRLKHLEEEFKRIMPLAIKALEMMETDDNISWVQASKAVGVSKHMVLKHLSSDPDLNARCALVTPMKPNERALALGMSRTEYIKAVLEARSLGLTVREITEQFGVSKSQFQRYRKAYNECANERHISPRQSTQAEFIGIRRPRC